ncbi:hypothetical protein AYO40_01290 [Planctomycetaceae bacterium SCGC AG-212-D15]|nr:hypothetical protein AYO40_01290 [Planctomycetaceae bacterium SCGC AG-212-D15]
MSAPTPSGPFLLDRTADPAAEWARLENRVREEMESIARARQAWETERSQAEQSLSERRRALDEQFQKLLRVREQPPSTSEQPALVESLRRDVQEKQDKLELLQAELEARNAVWHEAAEQRDAALAQVAQLQQAKEEQERRVAAFEARLREVDTADPDAVDLGGRFSSMNLLQHTDIPLEALGIQPAGKVPSASAAPPEPAAMPPGGQDPQPGALRSYSRSLLEQLTKINIQLAEDVAREHERVGATKEWLARMHGADRRRES